MFKLGQTLVDDVLISDFNNNNGEDEDEDKDDEDKNEKEMEIFKELASAAGEAAELQFDAE